MVTARIGRWWSRQTSQHRGFMISPTCCNTIPGIWGNNISFYEAKVLLWIRGNSIALDMSHEAPFFVWPTAIYQDTWHFSPSLGVQEEHVFSRYGWKIDGKILLHPVTLNDNFGHPTWYEDSFQLYPVGWFHPALNKIALNDGATGKKSCPKDARLCAVTFRVAMKPLRSSCIRHIIWNFQMQCSSVQWYSLCNRLCRATKGHLNVRGFLFWMSDVIILNDIAHTHIYVLCYYI